MYLTPAYAPALAVTSDAALVFYGASMLLAAVRGYAGCEVRRQEVVTGALNFST